MTSSTDDSRAGRSAGPGTSNGTRGAGQRLLGPDDALGDGGLRHQVGAGDLGRGQAAEQPQRQRDPGLDGQHRVAGGEDQPQQVVVDLVGEGPVEVRGDGVALGLQGPADLGVLARSSRLRRNRSTARRLATVISQAPGLRGTPSRGHCSRAATTASWASSSARSDVTGVPGQPGDQPGGLHPDDRLDRGVRLRSRHDMSSHHRRPGRGKERQVSVGPAAGDAAGGRTAPD